MTDQLKRHMLTAAGLVLIALSAFSTFLFCTHHIVVDEQDLPQIERISIRPARRMSATNIQAKDFSGVWNRRLQGKPITPSKIPSKPTKPELQPPEVLSVKAELLGTLVDDNPGLSRAWIDANGRFQMVKEGSILENQPGRSEVTGIENERVIILHQGKTYILEIHD
ncbi:hypothetical protein [Roseiconus lacunae]|uniref:hypothetical protein n=1 Tax=Roseiconus lacunae TaxID=2605694 RepID=UPI001E58A4E3|nr:hypothetical protein [Roseiconus lacunae]MCD0462268.1 hypothetical protein [Roseiconus lacunae]